MSESFYFGPYLICFHHSCETSRSVKTCSNPNCSIYNNQTDANYCYKCGYKIEKRQIVDKYGSSFGDYEELIENCGNFSHPFCVAYEDPDYSFFVFVPEEQIIRNLTYLFRTPTIERITEQIQDFSAKYKEEIEFFKDKFDTIDIRHGGVVIE